ncbi:MAG: hypothetical protein IK100_06030 [Muribaculaceae bacterium]|nr:hypothetical protein [Muribaculaceae bacterium]
MKGKILLGCIALVMLFACSKSGHIHLPGHGNVEKQNLKEAVVNHVSSTLTNGETVEYGGNSGNNYYEENGEVRFSTDVVYYVVAPNGAKEKRKAQVVCNEDRDKIIEWKDI